MSESLFPLRLTLWEELFVVDDFENYPANFMTRIRGRGNLTDEVFRSAVMNCIQSHPFFGSVVRRKGRWFYWEEFDDDELPIEFDSTNTEPVFPVMRMFDVFGERLWRIRFTRWTDSAGDARVDIFVEIHHAVCDGLGAIQFISDVAREIHDLHQKSTSDDSDTGKRTLRNANTDIAGLKTRGQYPQTWKEFFRGLPYHYKSLSASWRLIFTKVAPLIPVDSVKSLLDVPKTKLGYHKIVLPATESSKLRRTCRKQNTTVNTRVTAEIFHALMEWKAQNDHPPVKALRVIMPFNERNLEDIRLPSCNRVSISPITRKRKEIEDSEQLLASIERGVRVVKKGRLGINFHRALWFCKTFFRSLKRLARVDRIGASAMFANVGNLDAHLGLPNVADGVQCGTLTIYDVDLIPNIRVGTFVGMTMHEFQGETRIGIHYDSAVISNEQADSFFGLLKRRILEISG